LTIFDGKALKGQRYGIRFHVDAWREWLNLDGSVRKLLKGLLGKRLNKPHVPGSALHGELAGFYKIKLLKQGIRLIYRVDDGVLIVIVFCIGKREDGLAYALTLSRIKQAN
jgi:mRNA interferase RelE/StbE